MAPPRSAASTASVSHLNSRPMAVALKPTSALRTMAVTARPWLERLLLRLGPDARLVEGDDPDLARHAAARVLARYR